MRVGALSQVDDGPHHYRFTWSPIGVATEYLRNAEVIRNFEKCSLPSLSESSFINIDGQIFEEDLTSGGASDLPAFYEGVVENLDYKTLRYPGHYDFIKNFLGSRKDISENELQMFMEENIPYCNDDVVIIYVGVKGRDRNGTLRIIEKKMKIYPTVINNLVLKAIQGTTASAMVQCAKLLLEGKYHGCVLQSQINPDDFLNSEIIHKYYNDATSAIKSA